MKLMILGGGSSQSGLIKKAKERGHDVILIDYLESPIGAKYADKHLRISTFDTENVYKAAMEEKIEGIVTAGTDQPVYTCAVIAQRLKLNFYIDSITALNVTNKKYMKEMFEKNDIPTVGYRLLSEDFNASELDDFIFPGILKPVDSQGQRGIYKVNNPNEVKNRIKQTLSYSRKPYALLEEFYENDEVTVNGWVKDGETTILSVVDRVTIKNSDSIGVCLCHNFPSEHIDKHHKEIESLTLKIVEAFDIRNGPLYFQYLIGSKGIKVNEIAMRIGGAYEDITLPIICKAPVLDWLLDMVETGNIKDDLPKTYDPKSPKPYVSTQLFFCRPGKIKELTSQDEMRTLKGVTEFYYMIEKGQTVIKIENATARAGYMIIKAESSHELMENIDMAFNTLKITDKNGNNLVIKYNEYPDKYLYI